MQEKIEKYIQIFGDYCKIKCTKYLSIIENKFDIVKSWCKNHQFLIGVIVTLFISLAVATLFNWIATRKLTEALYPNNFILWSETPRKEYSPSDVKNGSININEISTYDTGISFNFYIKNRSKYLAKDVTLTIYLDKNTIDIEKGKKTLEEFFIKNFEGSHILRMSDWKIDNFIHKKSVGIRGVFSIPIESSTDPYFRLPVKEDKKGHPIYPYLYMQKDEARMVIKINNNYFYIKFKLSQKRKIAEDRYSIDEILGDKSATSSVVSFEGVDADKFDFVESATSTKEYIPPPNKGTIGSEIEE